MKQLLFLLLFPCLALAQYQGNANQKITLGEQTTADGLVYRGIRADTASKIVPFSDTSAYIILDTVEKTLWLYKAGQVPKWQQVGGSAGGGGTVTSITGGTGITGGTITTSGTLSADTSFLFTQSDTLSLNLNTRFAAKQNNITLTTTGTSGAATLINATLNIPQYSGGGGVTSFSAGSTGLTPSTATTGAVTLGGTLAVANGGTGSATQNFVDLTTTQSVGGAKTFTSAVTATRFDPTANTVTGNGMYLPATNSIGFSTAGTQRIHINSAGKVGIATQMTSANSNGIFNVNGTFTYETGFFCLRSSGSIDHYGEFSLRESGVSGNFGTGETGQLEFSTYSADNTIGALAIGTIQSRPVIFGTSNLERVRVKGDGEINIGYGTTDNGAYRLQVKDSVYVGGNVSAAAYTTRSDYDLKDEIQNIDYGINEVMQMQPVKYTYKSNGSTQLGFIAQDLGVITPEVVSFEDKMSVYYNALIPILTKAIQEQNDLIKALEQRILTLENK